MIVDKATNKSIKKSVYGALNRQYLFVNWSNHSETKNNWGDAVNPFLINKLSGKTPIHISEAVNFTNEPVYSVVGSILDNSRMKNLVVWGSGFKSKDSTMVTEPYPPDQLHLE